MGKQISDRVVVVTGAASGIGRATAKQFADEGAKVVLTARRGEALDDLAAELGRERAVAVPADVTDESEMAAVAQAALDTFGRVDVWVNNAAVTMFGRFEDVPHDEWRRVIETDVIGYANGAWAALAHLKKTGGTLINVGSVNSYVPAPYVSPYIAAKHAVRGMTASLRQELRGTGVDVVLVMPASIDTPLFQQAADHTGRTPKALNPTNPPEKVAAAIVRAAKRPRRELPVGRGARPMLLGHALAPALFERVMAGNVERDHFLDEPSPPTDGNLFGPDPAHTSETGGWREPGGRKAAVAAVAAVGAVGAGAGVAAARRNRGGRFSRSGPRLLARR